MSGPGYAFCTGPLRNVTFGEDLHAGGIPGDPNPADCPIMGAVQTVGKAQDSRQPIDQLPFRSRECEIASLRSRQCATVKSGDQAGDLKID